MYLLPMLSALCIFGAIFLLIITDTRTTFPTVMIKILIVALVIAALFSLIKAVEALPIWVVFLESLTFYIPIAYLLKRSLDKKEGVMQDAGQ